MRDAGNYRSLYKSMAWLNMDVVVEDALDIRRIKLKLSFKFMADINSRLCF